MLKSITCWDSDFIVLLVSPKTVLAFPRDSEHVNCIICMWQKPAPPTQRIKLLSSGEYGVTLPLSLFPFSEWLWLWGFRLWSNKFVWKSFVFDRNTWYYKTVCRFFVLRIINWSYNCLQIIVIIKLLQSFSTSVSADGFSLEFEWQQVSSSL